VDHPVPGVFILTVNVSIRMWYGMARSGVLPNALAKLHRTHKTPVNALYVEAGVVVIATVVAGVFGPANTFTVYALMLTFGLIVVYTLLNIGVIRWYRFGGGRAEFNPWLHALCPLLSTAAVILVGYKSIVPLPAAPAKYAPIVIGAWIAIGLTLLVAMRLRGHEAWLARAGASMDEGPPSPIVEPTALAGAMSEGL
jgi:amino acid transporter